MRSLFLTLCFFIALFTNAQTATDYYNQGLEKFKNQLPQEAVLLFDKAISLNPSLKEAYIYRGAIKAEISSQINDALADYNKAIAIDPSYVTAYYLRGLLYARYKKYEEAIDEFTHAIHFNSGFEEAFLAMANAKTKLKEFKSAIKDYSAAIEINPRSEDGYYGRAFAKLETQDSTGALQDINKTIELNDKNANAYCIRASIRKSKDLKAAKADLDKALEIDPDNQYAKNVMPALLSVIKADEELTSLKNVSSKLDEYAANAAIEEGKKFMAENGKKKSVVTTYSGLQYEILKQGKGPIPGRNDVVVINCIGKLLNGKIFDDTKNAALNVQGFIKGFAEGLQRMPVGAKYRFYIPYTLGYGLEGSTNIPGGALIVYEVELLSIKK
ncbi:MAG TPA: tetratricopeptide repeat protein [Chitinophagaceae bacterium]|nr:tetratricopeptide repeat protein [Chitinophagaceae bacterium]